jgi:hypothetical protein
LNLHVPSFAGLKSNMSGFYSKKYSYVFAVNTVGVTRVESHAKASKMITLTSIVSVSVVLPFYRKSIERVKSSGCVYVLES